ncbi:probable protein phosphatase 2C 24 isoform X1 [Prosopis cineraria]|uniref:probable protein phosphatase 2C 24 isoform X1 n=1 Tax=Prosopis cineraria TaxID=364024 RepID=UPI00240FF67C|nr:probable protein phosphatase 2C 24 isoform X1 [Prosopis cineraria]
MAEICCGVVSERKTSVSCRPSPRQGRRRRVEIRRFKVGAGEEKRPKLRLAPRDCEDAAYNCAVDIQKALVFLSPHRQTSRDSFNPTHSSVVVSRCPKFGVASVCGRRRDMEDAVAVRPWFSGDHQSSGEFHYFAVYDGHGCSHVAAKCKDRLHELVKEELEKQDWPTAMEQSLSRMDQEVIAWNANVLEADCRCELQSPECDAVGSTAVIAVLTADKVIVANCGDSRAVLCRGGKPIPLSSDHKPDRPDELNRIHEAGGRVIYWDGPRVQGMLAMSRAIGDNYLKPYVSCVPEVTITDRTAEDDCLILATDGLWDVVSNETACGVARTCLRGSNHSPPNPGAALEGEIEGAATEMSDKACSDASMLLTKLALARHSTDNVSVVVVDLRRGA